MGSPSVTEMTIRIDLSVSKGKLRTPLLEVSAGFLAASALTPLKRVFVLRVAQRAIAHGLLEFCEGRGWCHYGMSPAASPWWNA